jgi:hypothetical protein
MDVHTIEVGVSARSRVNGHWNMRLAAHDSRTGPLNGRCMFDWPPP